MGKTGTVARICFFLLLCFFAVVPVLVRAPSHGLIPAVAGIVRGIVPGMVLIPTGNGRDSHSSEELAYIVIVQLLLGERPDGFSYILAVGATEIWRVWFDENGHLTNHDRNDVWLNLFRSNAAIDQCTHAGQHTQYDVPFTIVLKRTDIDLSVERRDSGISGTFAASVPVIHNFQVNFQLLAHLEYLFRITESYIDTESSIRITHNFTLRLTLSHCQTGYPYITGDGNIRILSPFIHNVTLAYEAPARFLTLRFKEI